MTEPSRSEVECEVPPPGWWCSRTPGHDGPCAAREIDQKVSPERKAELMSMIRPDSAGGRMTDRANRWSMILCEQPNDGGQFYSAKAQRYLSPRVLRAMSMADTEQAELRTIIEGVRALCESWENTAPHLSNLAATMSAGGDDSLAHALSVGRAYGKVLRSAIDAPTEPASELEREPDAPTSVGVEEPTNPKE